MLHKWSNFRFFIKESNCLQHW